MGIGFSIASKHLSKVMFNTISSTLETTPTELIGLIVAATWISFDIYQAYNEYAFQNRLRDIFEKINTGEIKNIEQILEEEIKSHPNSICLL